MLNRPKAGDLNIYCTGDTTPMHRDQILRLVQEATANGGVRLSRTVWEWNVAGRCESPVTRERYARKDRKGQDRWNHWEPGRDEPMRLILHVPCRKCSHCLRLRRNEWVARIRIEQARSDRTWFGTLTLSAEEHLHARLRRAAMLRRKGTDFDSLAPKVRYDELCLEVGAMLTRYFKRLRKQSGSSLKYVAVFEAHKSGLPHLHVLLHEYDGRPVRKTALDGQWPHGFTHWRLVTPDGVAAAPSYVAKYLTKGGAKVRASLRYGRHTPPKGIGGRHSRPGVQAKPASVSAAITTPRYRLPVGTVVLDITETAEW